MVVVELTTDEATQLTKLLGSQTMEDFMDEDHAEIMYKTFQKIKGAMLIDEVSSLLNNKG